MAEPLPYLKLENSVIFWFRRDLRLDDNHALYKALNESNSVIPIFIYDSDIVDKIKTDDHRLKHIFLSIKKMNLELKKINKKIFTFKGKPLEIFKSLINTNKISAVYYNKDYEPYATKRDECVNKLLAENSISFKGFKDQVIFEQDEVTKNDGKPYVVYTPYSRKWMEKFSKENVKDYKSEDLLNSLTDMDFFDHDDVILNFSKNTINPPELRFTKQIIEEYSETRNFPHLDKTSKIGVFLRFGNISIRKAVEKSDKAVDKTFLKELIWREFFMQILWHYPKTTKISFKEKYERVKWRNNMQEFKLWCEGKTGYPIVDAGMNELNSTGFMHNRVRMIVASFLCKHLLIDWRLGEKYFSDKLFDYEQSSNIGNWQWVAGCGVDAAPYFRIFNPYEQQKKFDKLGTYIKKWLPYDYKEEPIVDHKFARQRCLETYKEAVS